MAGPTPLTWFDRCRGDRDPAEMHARLDDAVRRAGLDEAFARACGKRGLRRFSLAFEVRGGRVRLGDLAGEPLRQGGGPPNPVAFDAAAADLERAIGTLVRTLPPGFTAHRGVVGVVRDGDGTLELRFRFDEDADDFSVARMRSPTGEPHPMEDPTYLKAARDWEGRIAEVRRRWELPGPGESWRLADNKLVIGSGAPRAADVLAQYTPRTDRFEWLVEEPVADEAPFVEGVIQVTLSEAAELAAFAALRRGRKGVFQGTTVEGDIVFVGLRG